MGKDTESRDLPPDLNISDEDIYEAMKDIPGYLDITSGDLKELYRHAFRHARNRIFQSVTAGRIMRKDVITVQEKAPLTEVAALMSEKGISGVPVVSSDRIVVGVVSEKDFLFRMGSGKTGTFMSVVAECLEGKGCVAIPIRKGKAEDIMSAPPVTVHEDTTVQEIVRILKEKKINRLPVLDRKGCLVGIVSRGDIIRGPLS